MTTGALADGLKGLTHSLRFDWSPNGRCDARKVERCLQGTVKFQQLRYTAAVLAASVAVMFLWLASLFLSGPYSFAIPLLAVFCASVYGGFGPAITCMSLTLGSILLFLASANRRRLAAIRRSGCHRGLSLLWCRGRVDRRVEAPLATSKGIRLSRSTTPTRRSRHGSEKEVGQ